MNGTNQNQTLGKSELRYYFIRLTKCNLKVQFTTTTKTLGALPDTRILNLIVATSITESVLLNGVLTSNQIPTIFNQTTQHSDVYLKINNWINLVIESWSSGIIMWLLQQRFLCQRICLLIKLAVKV